MALALAVLGLIEGPSAPGASVSPRAVEQTGHHHCKCKSCHGASSCCCASDASEVEPPSRPSPAPRSQVEVTSGSGPCLAPSPCGGGDGLPATAPGAPSARVAALAS